MTRQVGPPLKQRPFRQRYKNAYAWVRALGNGRARSMLEAWRLAWPQPAIVVSEGIGQYIMSEEELIAITSLLDEHPDWWEYPCGCTQCRSDG